MKMYLVENTHIVMIVRVILNFLDRNHDFGFLINFDRWMLKLFKSVVWVTFLKLL